MPGEPALAADGPEKTRPRYTAFPPKDAVLPDWLPAGWK